MAYQSRRILVNREQLIGWVGATMPIRLASLKMVEVARNPDQQSNSEARGDYLARPIARLATILMHENVGICRVSPLRQKLRNPSESCYLDLHRTWNYLVEWTFAKRSSSGKLSKIRGRISSIHLR